MTFASAVAKHKGRKFRVGKPFTSVTELIDAIQNDEWVYHNHKVLHPGWIGSWQLKTITRAVFDRRLYRAIRNQEPNQ